MTTKEQIAIYANRKGVEPWWWVFPYMFGLAHSWRLVGAFHDLDAIYKRED